MVDLFTVLTVFLLQNYNVTGVSLEIPKEVVLPSAKKTEVLTPANVVTVTKDQILVGHRVVAKVEDVKTQEHWMIPALHDQLQKDIEAVREQAEDDEQGPPPAYRDVTVQADQDVEFSVIKRVMYTATEAGAGEVNFAVLKKLADSRQ
jgi:biopolymer transport protein ExbD